MRAVIEREVKLGAGAGFTLPDLTGVVDRGSVLTLAPLHLTATYFDTPDLRLARWGISVRYREASDRASGDEAGWTVKLPKAGSASGLVRGEYEFDGGEDRIPDGVLHLLRAYIRTAQLAAVARLRTDRIRVEVRDQAGRTLVEVDDDEVSVLVGPAGGKGRRVASTFREIEAELKAPDAAKVLKDVVAALRAAGAAAPDPTPKVVRALGQRAQLPPEVVVPAVHPNSPTAVVVQAVIAAGTARLLSHDPGVRLGDDPENVHQARVATRRLRSDLRTFRKLLDEKWMTELRDQLGWLADLLGEVRDDDVLFERLRAGTSQLPAADARAADALLRRLVDEREAARTALLAGVDSQRYVELLEALVDAAGAPPVATEGSPDVARQSPPLLQPAIDVVPRLVRRPWRHLKHGANSLGGDPTDQELHQVRILAKRCRYAAEAAAPVVGKEARRLGEAVAELQGVLGDLNDAVVAEAWLRGAVKEIPADQALVAGELIASERLRAVARRGEWKVAWKRVSSPRVSGWLTH